LNHRSRLEQLEEAALGREIAVEVRDAA